MCTPKPAAAAEATAAGDVERPPKTRLGVGPSGKESSSLGGGSSGVGSTSSLGSRLSSLWSDMFQDAPHEMTKEEQDSHRTGTSSRNASVLSVFWHNFTSMVGAGVLALPFAMACLGWPLGVTCLLLSWGLSFGTFVLLVRLHEQNVPPSVVRMDRYPDLTKFAFGDKWGFWLLTPFQVILFVGLPIAYTITAAISLQKVAALLDPVSSWGGAAEGGLGRWIVIFMAVNLCVVQVRSFHSLSAVSMIGTLASVFYALVAFVGSIVHSRTRGGGGGGAAGAAEAAVSYKFGTAKSQGSSEDLAFNTVNAIATIAFAYGGHNIAQEIQATLPLPPSTTKPMMNSVHLTFVFTALIYFGVAFTGYQTFGNAVEPNILISLSRPTGVMVAANLAVVFHVLAGFHVYLFPLLDYIDGIAIKKGLLPSAVLYRVIVRSSLVLLITFLAAAIPFFEVVLGFLGAISVTPTTFIMPCLLWLKLKKPRPASWEFWFCWATVPIMTAIMVIGATGAVRDFIIKVVKEKGGGRPFAW